MTQPDIFDDDAPWAERLPELRLLLEAYASVPREHRFTDTPEAPSQAMRSYLRIATYYPGRAFRVTAEILDTLKRGLDSPEVAAELATMPPIIVAEGQSKKDALVMMIPHLVAFTERGEQADAAVPETTWEWRQRLPNLAHLLGSYFHQDAAEEYPGPGGTADHEAIIADYFDTVIGDEAAATVHEIGELLQMGLDEAGLDRAETALGAGLLPAAGLSHENWLTQIAQRLKGDLQAQDYQKPENLNPAYPPHDKRAYPTR